jgi:hypothetical protein
MNSDAIPALGHLPLEHYVLSRWNDKDYANDDPATRRKRLARKFVEIGDLGRFVCCKKIERLYEAAVDD